MSARSALIFAAVIHIVWAIVPSISNFLIQEVSVLQYGLFRWTLSGAIFGLAALARREKWAYPPRDALRIAFIGFLGYGLSAIGLLNGLKLGGVVTFALVSSVAPVMASALFVWLGRETIHPRTRWALALTGLATVLIALGKIDLDGARVGLLAVALLLGAFGFEVLPLIENRRRRAKRSILQYLFLVQGGAGVGLALIEATAGDGFVGFLEWTPLITWTLVGVTLFACVIAFGLLHWLLGFVDGHRLVLVESIGFGLGAVYGWLLFDEPIHPLMLVGGGVSTIALWINARTPSSNDDPTPPVQSPVPDSRLR